MSQTNYESILAKARKVNELVKKGIQGEAEAARARLSAIIEKYGLRLEDIEDQTPRPYKFTFNTYEEARLLWQIIYTVCGTREVHYYRYVGEKRHKYADLTPYQYAEISEMYAFHRRQLNKEIKAFMNSLLSAYASKHQLFPKDHENSGESSDEDNQRTLAIMQALEDINYHKSLTI